MQTDGHIEGRAPALSDSVEHPPLPNVIIVPPAEERLATPPWAYFDAQAHAQAQAIEASRRTEIADDESPVVQPSVVPTDAQTVPGTEEVSQRRRVAEEDLEEIVDPFMHNERTDRQTSYEGSSSRGEEPNSPEPGPSVFPSVERDYLGGESFEMVHPPSVMSTDNLNTALTKPRKNSFSSLFRRSNAQNIDSSVLTRNARSFLRLGKPTITPKRSFDRPSPARASTVDPVVNRRFSFFELRRRFSTSSLASNQSSSSLAASSTLMSPITPSDLPPILPMPSILDEQDSPASSPSADHTRMETGASRISSRSIAERKFMNSRKDPHTQSPTTASSFLAPLQFESFDLVSEVLS
ncbi:hypothetical protein SCHPADRAFT_904407 [Schizopora paradoxa]|uniref:Uncharacterized protein n=1 Tax=Schizopora paradoxa TaxID=27342 RepID=A0A0H2RNM2_9AGAM|nr:hypothetical protein SCHPADRAFT_904407 [Schizopora paradoxa]